VDTTEEGIEGGVVLEAIIDGLVFELSLIEGFAIVIDVIHLCAPGEAGGISGNLYPAETLLVLALVSEFIEVDLSDLEGGRLSKFVILLHVNGYHSAVDSLFSLHVYGHGNTEGKIIITVDIR